MAIETEIIALRDDDGFLRPARLVEWARSNPDSQLHGRFEWDDSKAAEKYRLEQARQLIAIHVRDEEGNRSTISLVQDRNPDGGYRQLGAVMSNAELRQMAVRQAMREFRRWERRYKHLSELAAISAAADALGDESAEQSAA